MSPHDAEILYSGALQPGEGRVAERVISNVRDSREADDLVRHINMTVALGFRHVDMLGNLVDAALPVMADAGESMHVVPVLRSGAQSEVEERKREYRAKAVASGIPALNERVLTAPGVRSRESVRALPRTCVRVSPGLGSHGVAGRSRTLLAGLLPRLTVTMVFYPRIATALDFSVVQKAVYLDGSIHDAAQVAAAGMMLSQDTVDGSTVVKPFRIALLVPLVLTFALASGMRSRAAAQCFGRSCRWRRWSRG